MKKKKLLLLYYLCLLVSGLVIAQEPNISNTQPPNEFEYTQQKLQQVVFSAENLNDSYLLLRDNGSLQNIPHWSILSDPEPVGYVSGATPNVKAEFTNCSAPVWIKGIGSDGILFPPMQIVLNNGTATYGPQAATDSFPSQTVKYYEKFMIEWKMCNTDSSNENDWVTIDTSSNELYLTYAAPNPSSIAPYHTVIHLGCTYADGITGIPADVESVIVDSVFRPFLATSFDVHRKGDDKLLTYYASADEQDFCTDLKSLLKDTGNGRCGAFAELFWQIVECQGIEGSNGTLIVHSGNLVPPGGVEVDATSRSNIILDAQNIFGDTIFIDIPVYHFLVKHWENYNEGGFIELSGLNYFEAKSDLGALGIKGQGNVDDPRSIFVNHVFLTYNGRIYDPSYGVQLPSDEIALYEDESLEAVSGTIAHRIVGGSKKYYFWVEKVNTSSQDLQSLVVY